MSQKWGSPKKDWRTALLVVFGVSVFFSGLALLMVGISAAVILSCVFLVIMLITRIVFCVKPIKIKREIKNNNAQDEKLNTIKKEECQKGMLLSGSAQYLINIVIKENKEIMFSFVPTKFHQQLLVAKNNKARLDVLFAYCNSKNPNKIWKNIGDQLGLTQVQDMLKAFQMRKLNVLLITRLLNEGVSPNIMDIDKKSLLYQACLKQDIKVVEILVARGGVLRNEEPLGVFAGGNLKVIGFLLEKKLIDPNKQMIERNPPEYVDFRILPYLPKDAPIVFYKDRIIQDALWFAVDNKNPDEKFITVLLKHGAVCNFSFDLNQKKNCPKLYYYSEIIKKMQNNFENVLPVLGVTNVFEKVKFFSATEKEKIKVFCMSYKKLGLFALPKYVIINIFSRANPNPKYDAGKVYDSFSMEEFKQVSNNLKK